MNTFVEKPASLVCDLGSLGLHEAGPSGTNQSFSGVKFVFPTKPKLDSNDEECSLDTERVISIDHLHYTQYVSICDRQVHSFSVLSGSC